MVPNLEGARGARSLGIFSGESRKNPRTFWIFKNPEFSGNFSSLKIRHGSHENFETGKFSRP